MEHLITNPLNYFFALLALFVGLVWFARFKWYWHLPLLSLLALGFFLLTPAGANFAVALIVEDRDPEACESTLGLMVAGDPTRVAKHAHDYGAMDQETLSHAHRGVEWLNENPERILIVTGEDQHNSSPGQAKISYNYLQLNQIPPERIVYEANTSSYYDIAVNMSNQLQNRDLSLIASELTFKRASLAFEAQGFSLCGLLVPYSPLSGHPLLMVLPSAESITAVRAVMWELVGLTWYWWSDRI